MYFKSISQSSTLKSLYIRCDDTYENEESLSTSMSLFLYKLSTPHICAVEQSTMYEKLKRIKLFFFYI